MTSVATGTPLNRGSHGQSQIGPLASRLLTPMNRDDFRSTIFISAVTLMLCSTIAVTLRLMRSWQQLRRFELHDRMFSHGVRSEWQTAADTITVFLVLAVVCALVMSGNCAHLTTHGLGGHDYAGTTANDEHFQKVTNLSKQNTVGTNQPSSRSSSSTASTSHATSSSSSASSRCIANSRGNSGAKR
jgi:hypothetical protein